MARRIPGEFIPVSVNLASDPAVMCLDPLAELLFRRGLEHAKKNDRDGDIYRVELPAVALKIGNPTKAAAALVDAGLWVETGDGWRIRSFLKWNLSQAEQAEERERKQAAAILGNHKRHHKTERSADCIHCQEAMK